MINNILKSPATITSQLCKRFKTEIENNVYSVDSPLPTYDTIAENYGISKSTIHEAFKILVEEGYLFLKQGKGSFINPDKIKQKKRKKFKEIAIIAFNIFSTNDNYMIAFLEAINSITAKKEIKLHFNFIHGTSILNSENSLVKELILTRKFDGVILLSPVDITDIRWLQSVKIPFVAATSKYNLPIPQITLDHTSVAEVSYKLFIEKNVKKVAVFIGPDFKKRKDIIPYSEDLKKAFNTVMKNSDIIFDFISCNYNYFDAKTKALNCCFSKIQYDAIFLQSDIIAKGVSAAFKEMDHDINSVTTIHYCDLEEYIMPKNILKPLKKMGEKTIKLLEDIYLGKKLDNNNIVVKP